MYTISYGMKQLSSLLILVHAEQTQSIIVASKNQKIWFTYVF